jgi:hypothetical protein
LPNSAGPVLNASQGILELSNALADIELAVLGDNFICKYRRTYE